MLWLSRKDIEHISRRLLRDYLKKVPQKVDHIDPADFAEKMCGLQFTFADISEAHDAIGLTATSGVIITIPQRDGTRLDYELDGKTAFIDQSLVAENQIGRLNFTMMHEAAHQLFWMLYPEEYEVQTPRCVFRIQHQRSPTPATHSKTQETLDNALEQQPIDEDNAKALILRLAAEQYAALGDEEYETVRLRRLFSAFECVAELNADLLKNAVSEVLVTHQNVKLRLKNGQIIERSDLQ